MINHVVTQSGRRFRQIRDLLQSEGAIGVVDRLQRLAARSVAPKNAALPFRRADVLAADLARPFQPSVPKVVPGQPILVNWVTAPPSPFSGGHTTLFRIVRYLEAHGYRNRIYLYDVYGGDHRYYESILRRYYDFHGEVHKLTRDMGDAHAVFATSWHTAYATFTSRCQGKRFYFVQDFEPYFHAVSAASILAENTYRMGFHAITAGGWLAQMLRSEYCMECEHFEFGCDTGRYSRLPGSKRSGVVF